MYFIIKTYTFISFQTIPFNNIIINNIINYNKTLDTNSYNKKDGGGDDMVVESVLG